MRSLNQHNKVHSLKMTSGLPGLVVLLRYLRTLKLLRQPHRPKMSSRLQAEERFEPTSASPGAPTVTHLSIIQAQSYSTSTNQGIKESGVSSGAHLVI